MVKREFSTDGTLKCDGISILVKKQIFDDVQSRMKHDEANEN